LIDCFDHRFDKKYGEVTVYIVHNLWIYSFLSASHPAEKESVPLNYLFRDVAS